VSATESYNLKIISPSIRTPAEIPSSRALEGVEEQVEIMINKPESESSCSMLRVDGTNIVNAQNEKVVLKGAGLGGSLNMENFIVGYPGHEFEFRESMTEVLGEEKANFFFDKLIDYFFTEEDADFYASLGLNCIRVPFNYRHFIDDQNPDTYKPDGFRWLDHTINICAQHNLYVILDLHAVPGGQNQDWHSDTGHTKALFWEYEVFQRQAIDLWVAIAKHYVNNPVVAGYNLLNEPADPKHTRLVSWYERAEKAIRAVDRDHILYIDGNTYAMDFTHFPKSPLPNAVYACHDYAMLGFPIPGQAPYTGSEAQNAKLRSQFERKAAFMRERGVPVWNGEFGPVYASETGPDPSQARKINESRYAVLKQQLNIYAETSVSWSIWLYKDIGYQGMVHVSADSAWMKLIGAFVAKKQATGVDFWGVVDKQAVNSQLYTPFIDGLKKQIPQHLWGKKYPHIWNFERHVERVVRECLVSEYLCWEFAELFKDKSMEELEELAASFRLRNCVKREGLNEILREDAKLAVA
jgi:hypothetical protein